MIITKYGHRGKLLIMLVLQIIMGLVNLLTAYIVSGFIGVATSKNYQDFYRVILIGVVGFVIFGCLNYLAKYSQILFIKDINQRIKNKLVRYHLGVENHETSEVLSLMTNDMKQLETSGIKAEIKIISNFTTFIFAFIGSLSFDIVMTLVYSGLSFAPFLISKLTEKSIKRTSKNWTVENSLYTRRIKDLFSGISTITTYQAQPYAEKQANQSINQLEQSLAEMDQRVAFSDSLVYLVAWIASIIIPFGVGIFRVMGGLLQLSAFMGVVQLSNSFSNPLIEIMQLRNQLATVAGIKEQVAQAFAYEETDAVGEELALEKIELQGITVQLDDKVLLKPTSLTITPKGKILITAPSGFGKTTLLKVLQRQASISTGSYLVNDQSVTEMNRLSIQKNFSMIQQTPFMFVDTLRFNLTLGQTFSERDLANAIQRAGLTELIAEKGLDYQLGENGSGLSGGQIQRVEIARALLRSRPILLVDEGTSSLDNETSAIIRQTLINYPGTVVEVGHKLSEAEMKAFDRVVKLS